MACYRCATGLHEECINTSAALDWKCCCKQEQSFVPSVDSQLTEGLAWQKDDTAVKDVKSTGRKRAAVLFPLDKEAPCEWQGLKFAGGGKHPVIGCVNNNQKARHHGPDKNTLNNSVGNVHRICTHCHNRWHTLNDPDYYPDDDDFVAHDPTTEATDLELATNELSWATKGNLNVFFD